MARNGLRVFVTASVAALSLAVCTSRSHAIFLDEEGTIKFGLRTYVNARVGTQNTDRFDTGSEQGATFPFSASGHLRQNRAFIEAELDHNLSQLVKQGVGPLALLQQLPFRITGLKYHLTFRAEGDGLYDWGPREYRTAAQYTTGSGTDPSVNMPDNPVPLFGGGRVADVPGLRRRLRRLGTHRERLFQAYVEGSVGRLFVRFGRQIMVWGETDGFRLLDNINPLDSSFGGFLVDLDERRVPLDMLRLVYHIGSIGPLRESFLELYGAIDDEVGYAPGTPIGSPWQLPNLHRGVALVTDIVKTPSRTFQDIRGGGRFVWNLSDVTLSVAHYYTYVDTPAVEVFVRPLFPAQTFDDGALSVTVQSAPLVQISGMTATFAIPQLYAVVRSEFAYFRGEPRFRQSELDPWVFHFFKDLEPISGSQRLDRTTGGRRLGDSINYVIGFDVNRFIRFLNPRQSFNFSTQFFYKHLVNPADRQSIPGRGVLEGEVLPVPQKVISVGGFAKIEPLLVRQPTDQFLHTFLVGTSYRSGTINPILAVFYDWGGAVLVQPSVTFIRDPFRFTIDYSFLDASSLKGGSGISLLRDRDNIQFRLEYVL